MPECPFYVGQRVTLARQLRNWRTAAEGLAYGKVYTIEWIGIQNGYCNNVLAEHVVVRLTGVKHTRNASYPDGAGWHWTCFRPVTDISSLEALLHTTPVKQKEPA
jgi:hypothetical protein